MNKKIAFIGIGLMGLPMSKNILKAGYNLKVFNRSKNKAETLKEFGAEISSSIKDVVKDSDVVITMLTDDTAVDDVMNSSDFLENFMLIGFSDIGSAWTGRTPYSTENSFNSSVINGHNYTINLKSQKTILTGIFIGKWFWYALKTLND